MIKKFRYEGNDAAEDIRSKYGYDGDLLDIYAGNKDNVVHKWHHYIPIYDKYFGRYRNTPVKFLEIGVAEGGSLQVWRKYFGEDAVLFGIDINPECAQFDGQAGQVRIGSQADPDFLKGVVEEMGGVDVVLDDGSHKMAHIDTSLRVLYPMLSMGGTYMIEDLHTSYWRKWGGGFRAKGNFFNTVRHMVDDMHRWYHSKGQKLPELEGQLTGIHVHDSIVVLDKDEVLRPTHSRLA